MFMTVVTTILYSVCPAANMMSLVSWCPHPLNPFSQSTGTALHASKVILLINELCRAEILVLGLALQDMCCG